MSFIRIDRSQKLFSGSLRHLKGKLEENGSTIGITSEEALQATLKTMVRLLSGHPSNPVHQLASLDPGIGKTEALCSFLRVWKDAGFIPDNGALIILATLKEIESCIRRSGLQPSDFAVIVGNGHELNERGLQSPETAPVLFTTQEKLRRECEGMSFADVSRYHYRGRPRALRVWDEAFLPSTPTIIRKDVLLQPLADIRDTQPATAALLDALGESLSADTVGQVAQVPAAANDAHRTLQAHYGQGSAERWAPLRSLAGEEAIVVDCNRGGLHLTGGGFPLPDDFAPALILDASGRVRETYRSMEAAGLLERLPSAVIDYSRLRIHHWDRGASRSSLGDSEARQEVLTAAAQAINASNEDEPWLVIHALDKGGFSVVEELKALAVKPDRLNWLHWGNHHGTNDYRAIRKVIVLGLWNAPLPAYSALHVASKGRLDLATDKATLDALKAGEHRHNLLQAICRASVRNGSEGVCGSCEVYLVGRLGKDGEALLHETFPGVLVDAWRPVGHELSGSALRVAQELERAFAAPEVRTVSKAAVRDSLGLKSNEALRRVIVREDFRKWAGRKGIEVTTRAFTSEKRLSRKL